MMKSIKIILLFTLLLIIIFFINIFYKKETTFEKKELFKTETPQKRNIFQSIYATGKLEIKGIIKIGSLVAGTIKKIYVQENDKVKKGQLLTTIDNGKEDTAVRIAKSDLNKSILDLEYQKNYFTRQKALFEKGQISKDFFEQVTRDFKKAKEDVNGKQAALEKEQIEFNNTKIYAPDDGVIVTVGITEGMKITTDLDATVLFQIATDLTKMEATLDIDESDIGTVKNGQKVGFTVGTYLDKIFKGIITDVSYSAQTKNGILSYQATIEVDNIDQILHPGMTVNAKIKVAKVKDCLSISSQAFQINYNLLEKVAQRLKMKIVPLKKDIKKSLEKTKNLKTSIKYVWVLQNQSFEERAIQVNITDDNYFEIKKGLEQTDQIVIDIIEEDEMTGLYEKMFKGIL